jgi:acetoin:2,6-dichlorophenolindophenol oxidoreductase subunit beta
MMAHTTTVLDSLNAGLHQAMELDERVILLGEDILDPYGGAFKVTRGLSTTYPERVVAAPISEAGIVGVAAGMSLRGLLPVVEIMFGDFLTLAADQILNHITKFPWMYSGGKGPDEQITVPLVIRTPMGGRRGYGPTHSQTLEKLFLGAPGLRVIAPSRLALDDQGSPGGVLSQAILLDREPVLFIENKLLYSLPLLDRESLASLHLSASVSITSSSSPFENPSGRREPSYPTYTLSLDGAPPPQATLTAYGYMAELALQAVRRLAFEFEVFTELVIPTQLAPFDLTALFESTQRARRLLAIEEGNLTLGWGAEILARSAEQFGGTLHAVKRLAAQDLPIPASGPLEAVVLPGVDQIIENCLELVQTR